MRKLSAHYIFPASSPPLKYGILHVNDQGQVIDIIDTGGKLKEESKLEFYPGILTPGFVNSHCHLELSHLINRIPQNTGISSFVEKVTRDRMAGNEEIQRSIHLRASEMYASGTSVVGDIVNTSDTLKTKKDSPIYWHSFIELFGLNPDDSKQIWGRGKALEAEFHESHLSASLSPHAPYSVSSELWNLFNTNPPQYLSIHSQESREEEDLMRYRKGKLFDWLEKRGIGTESLPDPKRSSLESVLGFIPQIDKLLLVHNTYTELEDIKRAVGKFGNDRLFWVLCPNSNLYIDNSLPECLISNYEGLQICLGTDSLASNKSLSLLEEMKTIQKRFPHIDLKVLINWGTINGAKSLGVDKQFGSFEPGKTPGVVWIDNISFPDIALSSKSRSKRLL